MSNQRPVEVRETEYNKGLGSKDKEIVADLVMKGNNHLRKSALEVLEFGKVLIQLKEVLESTGTFVLCVKEEFAMTKQTAYNYIRVSEMFGDISPESETGKIILLLPPTVLVTLASPSTPSEAISEVFDWVRAGNKVKVADVKRLINKTGGSVVSNEPEIQSPFDNPDEADRKDIVLLEASLKERVETIIKEVDQVSKDLGKFYKMFPNKENFFERANLFFKIKKLSVDAPRVLKSLMTPERFRDIFKTKITELSA
jgi:hypothetical protein